PTRRSSDLEAVFQRSGSLHDIHAKAADGGWRIAGHSEKPGQYIGGRRHHQVIKPAPAVISRQYLCIAQIKAGAGAINDTFGERRHRSEEHTSELQSRENLVCRLLLEKKKKKSI